MQPAKQLVIQPLQHQIQHQEQEQQPKLPKSKKQIKKQLKKQKWQQQKKQKRQKQKQKDKEKRKAKKIENNSNIVEKPIEKPQNTRKRKDQYIDNMQNGLRVVIDMQFYQLMTQKEKNSLIKQLSYCHSVNRKYQRPFNYVITSSSEQVTKDILNKYHAKNWGISILQQSITEKFARQQLVYLTGDAQIQLEKFDQKDVYIIGGIVDHNRLKKITYDYANKEKIRCRRLPMDGVRLKASVHLAVNHIWQWMLKVYNGDSWGHAIEEIIPSRKVYTKEVQQQKVLRQEQQEQNENFD